MEMFQHATGRIVVVVLIFPIFPALSTWIPKIKSSKLFFFNGFFATSRSFFVVVFFALLKISFHFNLHVFFCVCTAGVNRLQFSLCANCYFPRLTLPFFLLMSIHFTEIVITFIAIIHSEMR